MTGAESGGCAGSLGRALVAAMPPIRPTILGLFSAILWPARHLAAQTPQQVQTAADEAIRRLDLQTEFPRGREPLNWHLDLPPDTLWIVIAIAIAVLLYSFRDTLLAWRPGGSGAWAVQEGETGAATPDSEALVLEAADELAAAGRFVEAMHVLLLQGLAYMRYRLDLQLSDSLTSREILRSTNLPETARACLRDVVIRVELTYFGKQPAALADYTACRESFHAMARALHAGAST
ncbi:MAG TPA: hypothetical protein VIY51_03670 [Xanthobacteraceae bacterium]